MLINLYEKYGDRLVYQKNGYEGKGRSRTPPPSSNPLFKYIIIYFKYIINIFNILKYLLRPSPPP